MHVLAVDTATEACVAAICRFDQCASVQVVASRAPVDARRHGELLAPLVAEVLAEAGLRAADLGGVVVGLGPGPFTSLRVGIVTAAALGDALGLRVAGVCTLDGIATAPDAPAGDVVVVTDARRRELYWARYRDGERIDGPEVVRPAVLAEDLAADDVVLGSGALLYPDLARHLRDGTPRFPDPAAIVALGLPALLSGDELPPLAPLYLRRPDAVPPGAPKAAASPARAGAR